MKSTFSVAWLLTYISIASVSAAIITPALPRIEIDFNLSFGAVEWVVSAFLIGYVAGQLIYGPLANRFGRLNALRLGLIVNLFGLLICIVAAFYHIYILLVLGRLVTGLGAASGLACTFMLINEWLPEEQRKTALAYTILSFALGAGLAIMLGGVITQYWHWQGCFLFLVAYGILMLWGLRAFDETLNAPKAIRLRSLYHDYAKALSSSQLVVFSMLLGTCSMISYCFSAAGPQIAHNYFNISVAEYGYWNGVNVIGMLAGGLSAQKILMRFSVFSLIAIGFIGCFLGVISLLFIWQLQSQSVLWFFITTASLYLFGSYLFAGGSYMASNAIDDKASASSVMSFINMGLATLCVVIMGYLSHNSFLAFVSILSGEFLIMLTLLALQLKFKA